MVLLHRGAPVDRPRRRAVQGAREPRADPTTSAISAASAAICSALEMALERRSASARCSSTVLSRRPAQHLSQRVHVGRLARGLLSDADVITLVVGLRFVFVVTPWRPTYHRGLLRPSSAPRPRAPSSTCDHWRHYFLMLGVLWGLMACRGHIGEARRSAARGRWPAPALAPPAAQRIRSRRRSVAQPG